MNSQNNYYNTLNVDKHSTAEEIKKQFRKLSMKYHPDKNNNSKESESIFQRISEAYDTLGDESKRKERLRVRVVLLVHRKRLRGYI